MFHIRYPIFFVALLGNNFQMVCSPNDRNGGNRSSAHLWKWAQRLNSIPTVALGILLFITFSVLLHSISPTFWFHDHNFVEIL